MKIYGRIKVTLQDEEYTFDPDNLMGSVWSQIETDTGLTHVEFMRGLDRRNFRACQWLIWYLRREAGQQEDLLAVNFPLLQFRMEAIPDEGEADAADTPPSASNTSSPSSNDSESDQLTGTT